MGFMYCLTGVTGFVGRELAAQLREQGCAVRGLVRRPPDPPLPEGVETVMGDVLDPPALDRLLAGKEEKVLLHAAAAISVRRRNAACERVNVAGTANVLAACRRQGVRRLVHFGSVDALPPAGGQPRCEPDRFEPEALPTAYGRSKAQAAQLVLEAIREGGLDATVLLPSAIVGPGDYHGGLITQMLRIYLAGLPPVSVAGGYDFVDVRDVAAAALAAARQEAVSSCYLVTGRYADITEVFDTLAAHLGRQPTRWTLPLGALYPVLPPVTLAYRLAGREPPLTYDALRLMASHPAYCHDRAARELHHQPRPLAQTLTDAADFLMAQRRAGLPSEGLTP